MAQENTKPTLPSEEDEIDLIALAKTLWSGRKTIIKITLIFMVIGLFVAIFSEKEYTASTTIVPATQGKSIGGSLGGLAAMAGINLGSLGSDSGISPSLYPQIVNSIPFQKQLLQTPLTIEGQDKPITYTEYYTNVYSPSLLGYIKKFTIGLPGLILKAIKSKPVIPSNVIPSGVEGQAKAQIQTITDDENQLIKQLKNQLAIDINDKDGYITISATSPEAKAAAQLARRAQILLQHYIINFKVQKSKEQLKFIQGRYQEKEEEFRTIQNQLASFKDRNQNINTTLAQSKLVQLQSEYDLAFSIYTELAKQLETQQLQVKQDTPVFTVLKPVTIPMAKSKPKRVMILVIWVFLGAILGIGTVFGKEFMSSLKKQWKIYEE
jgi:uncharacterized protein involved in exopolysaccharide biosynthesis